jgi:hypothetical protein
VYDADFRRGRSLRLLLSFSPVVVLLFSSKDIVDVRTLLALFFFNGNATNDDDD